MPPKLKPLPDANDPPKSSLPSLPRLRSDKTPWLSSSANASPAPSGISQDANVPAAATKVLEPKQQENLSLPKRMNALDATVTQFRGSVDQMRRDLDAKLAQWDEEKAILNDDVSTSIFDIWREWEKKIEKLEGDIDRRTDEKMANMQAKVDRQDRELILSRQLVESIQANQVANTSAAVIAESSQQISQSIVTAERYNPSGASSNWNGISSSDATLSSPLSTLSHSSLFDAEDTPMVNGESSQATPADESAAPTHPSISSSIETSTESTTIKDDVDMANNVAATDTFATAQTPTSNNFSRDQALYRELRLRDANGRLVTRIVDIADLPGPPTSRPFRKLSTRSKTTAKSRSARSPAPGDRIRAAVTKRVKWRPTPPRSHRQHVARMEAIGAVGIHRGIPPHESPEPEPVQPAQFSSGYTQALAILGLTSLSTQSSTSTITSVPADPVTPPRPINPPTVLQAPVKKAAARPSDPTAPPRQIGSPSVPRAPKKNTSRPDIPKAREVRTSSRGLSKPN